MVLTLKKSISEYKKLSLKQKLYLGVIFTAVFLVGLSASYLYQKSSANTIPKNMTKTVTTPIPSLPAQLALLLDSKEVTRGSTFSAQIIINSPTTGVDAADFVLNYDPEILKATSITSGNFFKKYPQKKFDTGSVKVSGVALLDINVLTIPKGQGTVATITFQALQATDNTIISFDKEKTIVASDGKNILGNATNINLHINK